ILASMAGVYTMIDKLQEALKLYEQAALLTREVEDRATEAMTLDGLALVYQALQRYKEAQEILERSLTLSQQIAHPAVEASGLVRLSLLLYQHLNRPQEAILKMERALNVLVNTGLPQDAAGRTSEKLQQYLVAMRLGIPIGQARMMSAATLQQIVTNTVAVVTVTQDRHTEWREA